MFVQPRTNAKLKNLSPGKTTSSQPTAKLFVNCWGFFLLFWHKKPFEKPLSNNFKCLFKIKVQNIFCRKKNLQSTCVLLLKYATFYGKQFF